MTEPVSLLLKKLSNVDAAQTHLLAM